MARKNSRKTPVAQETDLAEKVKQYLRSRAIGKKCYARADRLLEEIAAVCRPGGEILLNAGRKAVLVDPFETKFVAFRPLGFRRYELVIIED